MVARRTLPELEAAEVYEPQAPLNVILDSGAYTVWRTGDHIDIQDYANYVKANDHWITTPVCLDVIIPADPERAAKESRDNYLWLRKQGIKSMPIFHAGEDISWLERMLDDGAEYIGLAGLSLPARSGADLWYAAVWNYLVDSSGKPLVKVHGMGEGREQIIRRFPWSSTDSASWLYAGLRSGTMMINKKLVGHRNDKQSSKGVPDIEALEGEDRAQYLEAIRDVGLAESAFTRDARGTISRMVMGGKHYLDIQREVRSLGPVSYQASGFMALQPGWHAPVGKKACLMEPYNFHLVMGGNPAAASAAAVLRAPNVLISYAIIKQDKRYIGFGDFVQDPQKEFRESAPYNRYYELLKGHMADAPMGT